MMFMTVIKTGRNQDRVTINTKFIRYARAAFRDRADSPHYTIITMDGHTEPLEVDEPYDDFILRLMRIPGVGS